IMMAPSLALNPYNAAAAAPLRTVIDSMSSGLILWRPSPRSVLASPALPPPAPLDAPWIALLMGTPLTMISGELLPPKDDWPRSRIFADPPAPVGAPETLRPA